MSTQCLKRRSPTSGVVDSITAISELPRIWIDQRAVVQGSVEMKDTVVVTGARSFQCSFEQQVIVEGNDQINIPVHGVTEFSHRIA